MKKNLSITSSQIKNTLEEVDVSLSRSTIKRRLHEPTYRQFTTRCKPLETLKNRKARLEFIVDRRNPDEFENDGKRKVLRGELMKVAG